ncbi:ulp1 protease family, C-terminal catalytic domain-containing protein [Tanacetum coccineum]|uniref:Ulp1 protease family, C-terminal catalytic domain-containing protein n=1 Tax=Tanacetum coccineum TaxID=301880 RepID=A0ABQ5CUC8_9ASTR
MNYADIDYREESETEVESGESEEESSNEDKGIEDNSEDKMYINENKKIRTRNPPKSLANIMSKLTDTQIESLKDMGFGSFVGYKIKRFPTALARWLFLNYDPRTSCLKRTKTLWNGGLFNGPSTFLTVLYAQKCMPMVLKRSSTAVITKWTTRKIIMLQKEMIASNKKIIAPDTDIETHEIIAAKTTPQNERMTKSKVIAAKNAVSQSPIKAVNLGDISGKASNGISNTPKDAQLIEVWKLKGKKNQEMEVDLEKTNAHKTIDADKQGASMLKDMDFQNKSECTDWANFDAQFDPVKVVSTVEEPSSVLPANDIPCFDLALTPTPPYVNVNVDKDVSNQDPMLENIPLTFTRISVKLRLPPKKAKEQESTTTASTTTTSTTVKFLELVEVVSTIVKEPSLDLLPNDAPSFNLGLTSTPPNVNLDTDTTAFDAVPLSFAMPNATLVTPAIERKRKYFDKENISKEANDKESKKMKRTLKLSNNVKSPFIERVKKMLNEKDNVKALSYFIDDMEFVMKSAKVDNISNIDMVLFPVLLAKSHYYLFVFNLKTPKIEILDNSKKGINVALDERYGESFTKLKAVCERLEMSWRTKNNITDCGVFMMRHMETYMGYAKNWKCGFKNEGWEQQTQIYDLRKKYLSKILKSDLNCKRIFVLNELNQFRKLPNEEKVKYLKDRFVRIQNRVKNFS